MNKTLLLLLGLGLAILAIVLLWVWGPQRAPGKPEVREWDSSSQIKLEPVKITTQAKALSAVFTSHTEVKMDLRLADIAIETYANPLQRVFFSHVDSALTVGSLSSPQLTTLPDGPTQVFVSHYDAILRTDLVAPSSWEVNSKTKSKDLLDGLTTGRPRSIF